MHVKVIVKKALNERAKLPESRKSVLKPKEAKKQGVYRKVEKAKQLIRNKYLEEKDVRYMLSFYNRNKSCHLVKCEIALNMFGGRSFLRFLNSIYGGKRK